MNDLKTMYAQQREKEKLGKLNQLKHDNMINTVMGSQEGRNFVSFVLDLLQYQQYNSENSANAYRTAALQNAATFIYKDIYRINPDKCELMMREREVVKNT